MLAAVLAFALPPTRAVLANLQAAGYLGALIAGFFYALSLTAPLATGIFAGLLGVQPVLAAVIGGLGALLYDLGIFLFVRREVQTPLFERLKARFSGRPRLPRWVTIVVGALIIASPLPDELGVGLWGLTAMRARVFLPLSFGLNTLGLLIILVLT